ncbi:uncharacterized MFS-type transporter C09D4.1-like isoform X2 [Photinus pyralis]|uniref:uncharacterized MFS-type transporter C09D4.1-like isoform X2 n=1 Tax=Photinus pyralis TaxID=7054 RepID=UPI0012673E13|nr:uncharacterized MFS-type transporter C09D4.1-like isoform X2 [Photinus pyralis]
MKYLPQVESVWQIGFAIGIVTPPLLIRNHSVIAIIESDLFTIAFGVAIISTALVIVAVICFPSNPKTPPSHAAQNAQDQETAFLPPIKKLCTNKAFVLIVIVFGLNFGVFSALLAMLNQIVLAHYPDGFTDAGFIGILGVVVGILGSTVSGIILDKFRCYKTLLIISEVVMIAAMVCFTYTFELHISSVYITMSIVGFCSGALWSGNIEAVVETTYPQPEGISIGLLNGSGQGLTIVLTYLYQILLTHTDYTWANNAMIALLLLALVLLVFVRVELRRDGANIRKDTDNL